MRSDIDVYPTRCVYNNGKGTWESNQQVWVYDFELVD